MNPAEYGAGEDDSRERTDVPFLPGAVRTRRWFELVESNELCSPFRAHIYGPCPVEGLFYEAACNLGHQERLMLVMSQFSRYMKTGNHAMPKFSWEEDQEHVVGAAHCSCGFYTYYGYPRENDLAKDGGTYVSAVVETWGRMTYGDKGLRAQKMKVKALVLTPWRPRLREYYADAYRQLGWAGAVLMHIFMLVMAFGVDLVIKSLISAFTEYSLSWPWWSIAWIFTLSQLLVPMEMFKDWRKDSKKARQKITPEQVAALQEMYPHVEIFETWKEADTKYPATERRDLP